VCGHLKSLFFLSFTMSLPEIGLANLGNTCFLNAVLQGLLKCAPLQENFQKYLRPTSKKHRLAPAFQKLLEDVKGAKTGDCLAPRSFLKALWETVQTCEDDWFQPRQQADAAECLQYVLEGLHDALYRPVQMMVSGEARTTSETNQMKALDSWKTFFSKEYSPIVEHFYGQSEISLECQTCKTKSFRYEPWLMLKIPIPGGDQQGATVPTMEDCLNALFTPESIPDYACDTCKTKQPAVKQERISKLPNILILSFKRFTNTGAKIRGRISWNLNQMSFSHWMAFGRCPFTKTRSHAPFSTFAVIEHQGSAQSGHYHMYARAPMSDSWNNYDDCSIRKGVSADEVVSADSYILFLSPSKP
jgi:ubiquitin C-terminal hydrolase